MKTRGVTDMNAHLSLVACFVLLKGVCAEESTININQMETVELTSISSASASEPEFAIQQVDASELQSYGAYSISEGLDEVPGMIIENSSGRVKAASIRGTSSDHTLTLLNGRRMAPGFSSLVDLDQFASGGIDRAEIVKGPASAIYGSDAIGGVLNIITQRGESEVVSGEASYLSGFGDWDSQHTSLSAETRQGAWGISGSANYRYTNDWESGDGNPSDVDQLETFGGFVNLDYHVSETAVLRTEFYKQEQERIGMRPTAGGAERTANDERVSLSLEYEQSWNDGDTLFLGRIYRDAYETDIEFDTTKAQKYNTEVDSALVAADARVSHRISESVSALLGLEYYETEYEIDSDDQAEGEVGNSGIYGQLQWTPWETLALSLGSRLDNHEEFGSNFSPRVTAEWGFLPQWKAHASFGSGFRAPNVTELELLSYQQGGKVELYPNEDLDPETSISYEAGLSYEQARFSLGATYFHTEIEDMISAVTTSTSGSGSSQITLKEWQNLSEVEIDGVEFEFTWALHPNLDFVASHTWLDPIDKSTGDHVEGQYKNRSRLKFQGRLPELGLRAQLGFNFDGEVWGADDVVEYEDVWTVDLKLVKSFSEQLDLEVGANNLLDDDTNDMLPVNYYAGVRFSF
jgi:outer membrane receptor for ferrienterochelin and colicins